MATWRGWDPEDLLGEAGILLGRVRGRLRVQGLVHLGQDDLAQVEEALGGGRKETWDWLCVQAALSSGAVREPPSLPSARPHLCWPAGT